MGIGWLCAALRVRQEGRTTGFSLHEHPKFDPSLRPVYIADAPGIGDGVGARNDIVRLVARLASDDAMRQTVRVLRIVRRERAQTHTSPPPSVLLLLR